MKKTTVFMSLLGLTAFMVVMIIVSSSNTEKAIAKQTDNRILFADELQTSITNNLMNHKIQMINADEEFIKVQKERINLLNETIASTQDLLMDVMERNMQEIELLDNISRLNNFAKRKQEENDMIESVYNDILDIQEANTN